MESSEYVVEGKLRGGINAKEGIKRKTARVQFDYDEKEDRLEGGIFSSGWVLGGKKTGQVIGRDMDLRRSDKGIQPEADGYKRQNKGFGTKLFGSEKEKVVDFELMPEKATEKSEFKAILSNGVTVELVNGFMAKFRNVGSRMVHCLKHLFK